MSVRSQPSGRREDVLAVLRGTASAMTIVDIADQLEVHPNTVRFHLEALIDDGRIERIEPDRKRQGRPPLMYRAVAGMDPGGTRRYRLLAEILTVALADDPHASAKALDAGRAWARRVTRPERSQPGVRASITRLMDLLGDLGFSPQRLDVGGDVKVGLRHCPFLELADEARSVVCPIHLGLMQGAMKMWNAPATVDRLEPFVEPDLCVAHLALDQEAS
ncbi:putative transcriptional regulator [Mycolicibacterium rhodesiae NBB3]|uniref:Putative transcriptional regulator n=1 Tax=Mycolicibacterium rhodesiae (strain NBB3) TaxID=710685 RepID=G8RRI0_MYCRN|nr:putative transcriptional regulator [Mycolicibacterium rhodesiae NBB3]